MDDKDLRTWADFDEKYDTQKMREIKDVPFGKYIVTVERLALTKSQKGEPMVTIWFKVDDSIGEFQEENQRQIIFYNQVIVKDKQRSIAISIIKKLAKPFSIPVEFYDFTTLGKLLNELERIVRNTKYYLEYSKSAKGNITYMVSN